MKSHLQTFTLRINQVGLLDIWEASLANLPKILWERRHEALRTNQPIRTNLPGDHFQTSAEVPWNTSNTGGILTWVERTSLRSCLQDWSLVIKMFNLLSFICFCWRSLTADRPQILLDRSQNYGLKSHDLRHPLKLDWPLETLQVGLWTHIHTKLAGTQTSLLWCTRKSWCFLTVYYSQYMSCYEK